MIIYLARHGQTTGDVENRYGGEYDDHLTESGRHQAESLGKRLSNLGITRLYTSPKIRAKETAEIVSKYIQHEPELLEGFKECNRYGVLTGLTKSEAIKRYPSLVEKVINPLNTIDGGEEYSVFKKRILTALGNISAETKSSLCVITHGGPIRLIYREILKLGEIEIDDCAYSKIEFSNNSYKLLSSSGITLKSTQVI